MNKNRTLAVAAALSLSAAANVVGATPVAATGQPVLFVAGNATNPIANDVALIDVIEGAGHTVVVADDDVVTAADADSVSTVVISSSIAPNAVGDEFRNVDTPVVVFEPYVFDDMGLTRNNNTNRGERSGTRSITIIDPSHPLAAGLANSPKVTTKNVGISWGRPLIGADVIARITGSATQAAVFTYAEGAQMNGLVAPAVRTGLFPSAIAGTKLTAEGTALVVAAIDHAVASAGPPVNQPPQVDAGDDQRLELGDTIQLDASLVDDGLPVPATLTWSGPAGVAFGDANAASTTATVPGLGTYTLTVTAADGEYTASDTVEVEVVPVGEGTKSILYVAGRSNGVVAERPAIDRLRADGFEVTVVDDDLLDIADVDHDLVLVSASISPGKLDAAFAQLATPMVVWEPFVYDDLGFVNGSGTKGAAGGQRNIVILRDDHPITAGFDGTVAVTTQGRSLSWGKPQGAAIELARHATQSSRIALFAYEAGTQMYDAASPARRVGLFLAPNSPQVMTSDGWTLFDRSIDWALTAPRPAPVAVATADPTEGLVPQTITFDGTASTGDIVSYEWDFGDGTTATGASASHTYELSGDYVATLTVTDDSFRTSVATVSLHFDDTPPVIGGQAPIARYDFVQRHDIGVVYDTAANGSPLNLDIQDESAITWLPGGGINIPDGARIMSAGPANKIIDAVTTTEAITIEAWIDPKNTTQSGPARIATLSNGVTDDDTINVMLGQGFNFTEGDRIEGRFNTEHTTDHGQPGVLSRDAALDGDLAHVVFTRQPDGTERIYINGSLSAEWHVSGSADVWDPDTPLVIGNDAVASRPWRGDLHLVQFYDRALDPTEVCTHASQGPGRDTGADNLAPIACLTASSTTGVAPHTIDVDSLGSADTDGSISAITWNLDDGTTSTDPAVTHTYTEPGTYDITLTVTDDDGAQRIATHTVEVEDPTPPAPLTIQESSGMRVGNGFFKEDLHVARENWLGRELNWTAQFTDHSSVEAMGGSSNGLFTSNNAQLPNVADRMNISVSVGLAFGPTDLKNGGVDAVAENLQKTLSGEYDFRYYRVAQRIVEGGYPDAVIRLGHEFNGLWAPWSSQGNEALFIAAWRHVHNIFSNVSPDFRYDWGGLKEGWNGTAPQAYPGDEYVDIVSQSIYWKKKVGFYVWDEQLFTDRFVKPMNDALQFAIAHGKQVAYSEWGILQVDEPLFIDRMYEWMTSLPATGPGSMAYNVYWDSSSDLNRLYRHPLVEARYKELFG